MWFEDLTGFKERSGDDVRANLKIKGNAFVSKVNGRKFTFGSLEIPTLKELKENSPSPEDFNDHISVSEVVGNVRELHSLKKNENALFQAASQFNLLEMVSPHVTPEDGIDGYENDHTQGPACAISCGAGTIYRNYFVKLDDQIGQTQSKQIDCLDLIGKTLENHKFKFWNMQNGYAMFEEEGLHRLNMNLNQLTSLERETLKEHLKVGIQWNTEVTTSLSGQQVSQIYCSALPVAYSRIESFYWENFARLILEATYESSLYAALINLSKNKSNKVFLTLVGGGAFGNAEHWILESLLKAINKFKNTPLDVRIVSYGVSNPNLKLVIENFRI